MGTTKSKIKTVILPEEVIEQLRCSFCKQYLSCSPIRLLSDGKSVCGRCSVSNCEVQVYREIKLEVALSHVKFPCCYKDYGCQKKLLFDHSVDHETKCVYFPFLCPSLPFTTCSWKGSVAQVRDHFYASHLGFVNSIGKFQIDISVDKENILMVVDDHITFLIKYKYEASTSILQYDVRYFSPYVFNENFKVQLISSLNPENNINLKGDKCLPYSFNPSTFQNRFSLTLNKFLAVLANPTIIEVEIILPSIRPISRKPKKSLGIINYEILELLRCTECQNYLSLPIFDGPQGTVCSDCNNNYPPSKNEDLHKLVMEANYPCRWNGCKVICKGHSIRVHEIICPYQPYKCPSPKCSATLTVAERFGMELHLAFIHGYQYFAKNIVYSSNFLVNNEKNMVSIAKNNEIVFIKHKITANSVHNFTFLSLRSDLSNITAHIHFEHFHCKLKSRKFSINNNQELIISPELLPKCFRVDKKMSVFIEVH